MRFRHALPFLLSIFAAAAYVILEIRASYATYVCDERGCRFLSDRTVNIPLRDDTALLPPPAACPSDEVLANMRWLTDHNDWAAYTILYGLTGDDAGRVRRAFKWGQKHRQDIADRIDLCSDIEVIGIASSFSASGIRIDSCETASRAHSVTCPQLRENIRWAAQDAGPCAGSSRTAIIEATRTGNANRLRRAVQYAQGHDPDVFRSVEYFSNRLLIEVAAKVIHDYVLIPSPFPASLSPSLSKPGCGMLPQREQTEVPFPP